MNGEKVFMIKSVKPQYRFVQEARCVHCNAFIRKPMNDNRDFFLSWCSFHRKNVGPKYFACPEFMCNSKYKLVNQFVQLNMFDYA